MLSSLLLSAQNELPANWRFRQSGNTLWFPAKVPGTNYTDLLALQLIPDPFIAANEKTVNWVDTCDWEYVDSFPMPADQSANYRLLFEGLDTYADVYLNGEKILSSDNMFRQWEVSVKHSSLKKMNGILVHFYSPRRVLKEIEQTSPLKFPGGYRVFGRKAAYQFGWDWGPELHTCGIWKPVRLIPERNIEIKDVHFVCNSLNEKTADISFLLKINALQACKTQLRVSSSRFFASEPQTFNLKPGENNVQCDLKINNPDLWWPNGSGKSYLYDFSFKLKSESDSDQWLMNPVGLRKIELVTDKDKDGQSFFFRINGRPIFMKGANVIPPDHFLPRAGDQGWLDLVKQAVDQNMNMLRVWGGGVYPPDAFYKECDRRGILVWQDFMFACAMYPGDSAFLENVNQEVREQIIRLRNHPSLALWCGNNEIDEGWHNWGWQKEQNYSTKDSAIVKSFYDQLFETNIKSLVDELDTSRRYWPSSPSIGWGHAESLKNGDSHYWGVWWGKEPFDTYAKKVPRFMSEYGFQAMPPYISVAEFCGAPYLQLNSPAMKNHQKHPTGYETITEYLNREYRPWKDVKSFGMISMALQCDAMKIAIGAQRKARPYCMGTLYWQLNDTWPVVSWSSVDYYHRLKASAYLVRELYKTAILVTDYNRESKMLDISVVSDSINSFRARLELKLLTFTGDVKWTYMSDITVESNQSSRVLAKKMASILRLVDTTQSVLSVRLIASNRSLFETTVYFCQTKDLKLTRPSFSLKHKPGIEGKVVFEVSSPVLAKFVEITYKQDPSYFNRNYFDMLPGEKYLIFVNPDAPLGEETKGISVQSIVDTY